ncbi:MAG: hypothetical protein HYS14_01675 [Candidatus Rokubacteria bacterium]|nr:hypothetical protein [Candidatus Rokubacteria bacterium]
MTLLLLVSNLEIRCEDRPEARLLNECHPLRDKSGAMLAPADQKGKPRITRRIGESSS